MATQKRKRINETLPFSRPGKAKKLEEKVKIEIKMETEEEAMFPHFPNVPAVVIFDGIRKFACESFIFLFRQWPLICKNWYLQVKKWTTKATKETKQGFREPYFWKTQPCSYENSLQNCPFSFPLIYDWNIAFDIDSLPIHAQRKPLILSLTTDWSTDAQNLKKALTKYPMVEEVKMRHALSMSPSQFPFQSSSSSSSPSSSSSSSPSPSPSQQSSSQQSSSQQKIRNLFMTLRCSLNNADRFRELKNLQKNLQNAGISIYQLEHLTIHLTGCLVSSFFIFDFNEKKFDSLKTLKLGNECCGQLFNYLSEASPSFPLLQGATIRLCVSCLRDYKTASRIQNQCPILHNLQVFVRINSCERESPQENKEKKTKKTKKRKKTKKENLPNWWIPENLIHLGLHLDKEDSDSLFLKQLEKQKKATLQVINKGLTGPYSLATNMTLCCQWKKKTVNVFQADCVDSLKSMKLGEAFAFPLRELRVGLEYQINLSRMKFLTDTVADMRFLTNWRKKEISLWKTIVKIVFPIFLSRKPQVQILGSKGFESILYINSMNWKGAEEILWGIIGGMRDKDNSNVVFERLF